MVIIITRKLPYKNCNKKRYASPSNTTLQKSCDFLPILDVSIVGFLYNDTKECKKWFDVKPRQFMLVSQNKRGSQ